MESDASADLEGERLAIRRNRPAFSKAGLGLVDLIGRQYDQAFIEIGDDLGGFELVEFMRVEAAHRGHVGRDDQLVFGRGGSRRKRDDGSDSNSANQRQEVASKHVNFLPWRLLNL